MFCPVHVKTQKTFFFEEKRFLGFYTDPVLSRDIIYSHVRQLEVRFRFEM